MKDVVFFLERMLPLNIREMLNKEGDSVEIESYLRVYFSFTPLFPLLELYAYLFPSFL